jgi:hypothetical protein
MSIASFRRKAFIQILLTSFSLFLLIEISHAFSSYSAVKERAIARRRPFSSSPTLFTDAANKHGNSLSQRTLSPSIKSAVDSYIDKVRSALENTETFVSLSLVGRSKRHVKEYLSRQLDFDSQLRGTLRTLDARLIATTESNYDSPTPKLQLQVTFKYHLATDVVKNWPLDTVPSRLQTLLLFDSLTSTTGNYNNDNDDVPIVSTEWDASSAATPPTLGSVWGIQKAILTTTQITLQQDFAKSLKCIKAINGKQSTQQQSLPLQHDRVKQGPLSSMLTSSVIRDGGDSPTATTANYLQALGLVTADGQPKPKQASKLKQCNKFVEIVSQLVCERRNGQANNRPQQTKPQQISILDMGCGRGYLTFALHDYLTSALNTGDHDETLAFVQTKGIDVRPKLVQECNQIAKSLGDSKFDGLIFEQGTIESICSDGNVFAWTQSSVHSSMERISKDNQQDDTSSDINRLVNEDKNNKNEDDALKILIALHACDTATDDALWAGIRNGADIIVVAPCCHKQVRPQINQLARAIVSAGASASASKVQSHPLADILKHPIYRERLAETVTDSMRALLLELAGYSSVQVFEFIGGEHTSKNSMITAVRQPKQSLSAPDNVKSNKKTDEHGERIRKLASFHGVYAHKLAEHMGLSLDSVNDNVNPLSARNMPPL